MQPGQASYLPPEFPATWCGLWRDAYGKLMYLKRISGRHLAANFSAALHAPFYPLSTVVAGTTERLPALYQHDPQGYLFLKIEIGEPEIGPTYEVEFIFGEGDRLRPAEATDPVSGVIARPRTREGLIEQGENPDISWAFPLSNYSKADDAETSYLAVLRT